MKNKRTLILSSIILLITLYSCDKADKQLSELALPITPILSNDSLWALVNESYVQARDIPGENGIIVGIYRKGNILSIEQEEVLNSTGNLKERWILGSGELKGWIPEKSILIFPTKNQAETAAKRLYGMED